MTSKIFNEKLRNQLTKLIKEDRLPQINLIHGFKSLELAESLLIHPMVLRIDSEKETLLGKDFEEMPEFLSTKGYKMVLIVGIHKLAPGLVQKLLKTLEEPYDKAYIIMTTDHIKNIDATLRSRAACWQLRGAEPNFIVKHFFDETEVMLNQFYHQNKFLNFRSRMLLRSFLRELRIKSYWGKVPITKQYCMDFRSMLFEE